MTLAQDRIARGQCPTCGKEAAPYRLCTGCRFGARLGYHLRRGEKLGALNVERRGNTPYYTIGKNIEGWRSKALLYPREGDKRAEPRLRGVRVDIEQTLVNVIEFIGRPCTIEEIAAAWGKLRAKRDAPLANDLGRLIAAEDKRARKAALRARAAP